MHHKVFVNQKINVMKSIVFSLLLIATNVIVGFSFYKVGKAKAQKVFAETKSQIISETLNGLVYVLPEVTVYGKKIN